MRIGIDIDNVLVDLTGGFCDFYNRKYGGGLSLKSFEKYWLSKVIPISPMQEYPFWKEYYDSDSFDDLELIRDAKQSVNLLKQKHELMFITARNLEWKPKTVSLMVKHFPKDCFKVIFSGDVYGGKTKHEICSDLEISVIIEDHPEKSREYAENGMRVILFERPWNKNVRHRNIVKAKDWREIVERVEEMEERRYSMNEITNTDGEKI